MSPIPQLFILEKYENYENSDQRVRILEFTEMQYKNHIQNMFVWSYLEPIVSTFGHA